MFKKVLLASLLLMSSSASADVVASVGAGKGILSDQPFERVGCVGYQYNFNSNFFVRPEVGYFNANSVGTSSSWTGGLLGVQVTSTAGTNVHLASGPAYLQNPDNVLGGNFQFTNEAGIGLTDKNVYLGLAWKHLSSAGIEIPNQGRDFIVLQLGLKGL
jgi:hypothetical protein